MKKILIISLLLFSFICGCSELERIEVIKKKYLTGEIYKIDSDEFIVIINKDNVRYIEMERNVHINVDLKLVRCIGYDTDYSKDSKKDATD